MPFFCFAVSGFIVSHFLNSQIKSRLLQLVICFYDIGVVEAAAPAIPTVGIVLRAGVCVAVGGGDIGNAKGVGFSKHDLLQVHKIVIILQLRFGHNICGEGLIHRHSMGLENLLHTLEVQLKRLRANVGANNH